MLTATAKEFIVPAKYTTIQTSDVNSKFTFKDIISLAKHLPDNGNIQEWKYIEPILIKICATKYSCLQQDA